MTGKTNIIRQRILIPAAQEEVYDALLDSKKHSEFTGSKAKGKPEVGAKFTAWDGYISGKILELEEGKRILQEWETTEWPEGYPPSRVEFTFNEVDEKTELTMVHSGFPIDQKEGLQQGWIDYYWEPLKNYFKKKIRKE
jgi:activator of HSP90 ATPase